ncbi:MULTISPECIES: hypothetical protein [Delftia]|uniref:Uncharacterized protein n=1 Tax=Delftia lacustris TaxID=558537 RepID=A0A7T2YXV9_9BURK|nr:MULTISPECIES: hypothetical protein [Delftia]EPD38417.1 hypothetical protein HMPREF9702_04597 [Delftia acidovorans CCUG 15835]KAA9173607.1 hypothetical protein F3K36_15705 [Delftia sp. BR1]QPS82998.1 hypothetical protein I6G47_07960 [Delftia lacustris]
MTTAAQRAWEGLSNSMRLYVESRMRFKEIFALDREEAVKNQDLAIEAKLEKFHTLYDVTKNLPGFNYFEHGDTSLLIALRNAIHHHEDHELFRSWNARIYLDDGIKRLAGAEFLLGSTTPSEDEMTVRFYYLLNDFYTRLKVLKNYENQRNLWDNELQFASIAREGVEGRYPEDQVYVDVMPAFMSAVRRVRGWLDSTGFTPVGYDSETYYECFEGTAPERTLNFIRLRLPYRE